MPVRAVEYDKMNFHSQIRELPRGNAGSLRGMKFGWLRQTACHLIILLTLSIAGCRQDPEPPPTPRTAPRPSGVRVPAAREVAPASPSRTAESLPATRLTTYELKIAPDDLANLDRSAFSNDTVPATFLAGGQVYEGVKLRYRGAWARSWPKKPLKIFFNAGKPFAGQRCLNLNSCWRDPAFVREHFAYQIYAACGVPSSRTRMVRLLVNGHFYGLYVEVEQPDKAFLNRQNLAGASAFKANSRANQADERDHGLEQRYASHYEKQTRKSEGLEALQKFCHGLARATNTLEFFTREVDLDRYINYLAATTLTQHWDCYNKNHFLVQEGDGSKKWFAVPWDLDRTLGDFWDWSFDQAQLPILLGTRQKPGITGWNRMMDRFFSDPTLRDRFAARLRELLEKEFTAEKLFPMLDQLEAEISADATLDRELWPSQTSDLHAGIAQVKHFIERRRAFLLKEIQALRR